MVQVVVERRPDRSNRPRRLSDPVATVLRVVHRRRRSTLAGDLTGEWRLAARRVGLAGGQGPACGAVVIRE